MINHFDLGRIADPVHGYIQLTGIEQEVVDRPITQRLRNVAQSGLAHLVYPELRTSRFSHSLGAMHLASRYLSSCLRNADRLVVTSFVRTARAKIEKLADGSYDSGRHTPEEAFRWYVCAQFGNDSDREILMIVEQGLRLAALLHDLGHLPFSHDFEDALQKFARIPGVEVGGAPPDALIEQEQGAVRLHERLGIVLTEWLQVEVTANAGRFSDLSFRLARDILKTKDATNLDPPSLDSSLMSVLASLISGELDVDRSDFLMRDGRNYVFEFAGFDIERLAGNLRLVAEGEEFRLVVLPAGVRAVESFLLARYRSYQYGVRHHKVAQVSAALQEVTKGTLQHHASDLEIQQFLEDLVFMVTSVGPQESHMRRSILNRFARYDDIWWTQRMRAYRDQVVRRNPQVQPWFDLVLDRGSGPISLWKQPGDLMDALNRSFDEEEHPFLVAPSPLRAWNALLPKRQDLNRRRKWDDAVKELNAQGILVSRHHFRPWKELVEGESTVLIWVDPSLGAVADPLLGDASGARLQPVSRLSPIIRALRDAWSEDLQVHAFANGPGSLPVSDHEDSREREILRRLTSAMVE